MEKKKISELLKMAFNSFVVASLAFSLIGCSPQDTHSQQIPEDEGAATLDSELKSRLEEWIKTPKNILINDLKTKLEEELATKLEVTPENIRDRIEYSNKERNSNHYL